MQIQLENLVWENKELEERLLIATDDRKVIEMILKEIEEENEKAVTRIDLLENELQELKEENMRSVEVQGKTLWNSKSHYEKDVRSRESILIGTDYGSTSMHPSYNRRGLSLSDQEEPREKAQPWFGFLAVVGSVATPNSQHPTVVRGPESHKITRSPERHYNFLRSTPPSNRAPSAGRESAGCLCLTMNMMNSRFTRFKGLENEPTPNLFVANCGPAVGMSFDNIESAFGIFGKVVGVHAADETGTRVIVCFSEVNAAQAAFKALNGLPCADLGGRIMHISYSVVRPLQKVHKDIFFPVYFSASDLGIPGIYLVHDFITVEEEKRLLAEVDNRQWRSLSKRRVQHYGYEFLYETRNIDSKHFLGELPSFVSNILQKILSFPGLGRDQNKEMDQLTVNEYPCGVGLSPHIDTHSAFDELIFSLSTAGPCIMEFRRYPEGTWCHPTAFVNEIHEDTPLLSSYITRKAIFLPPRSMILMSGEGRYAWHHYIPHRKVNNFLQVDRVGEKAIGRSSRRVSFTFRKVRKGPCCCPYKQYCDSQLECRDQQVKQNIVQSSLPLKREAFCPTDTDRI
ncbi:unnamed protein product [Musa hybrid cultivar]